jgi:stage II sporulation protein GA (sporulation sigma-E factor processing peptidase)
VYYELYIDVLFLENLLVDYLLLMLVGRLLKCPAEYLRKLIGSAVGSAGVCALYLLGVERSAAGFFFIYVILSTVMVKVGLRIRRRSLLMRAVGLLYICGLLLGGIFQWIQRHVAFPLYPFLFFSLTSYSLLSVCMEWLMRYRSRTRNILEVTLCLRGQRVCSKALLDTGNQLRDPVFGKPVCIITEQLYQELRGQEPVLTRPIPFRSIGKENGLMEVFTADSLSVRTDGRPERIIEHPLLGIVREPLSSEEDYHMILHPDYLR